MILLLIVAASIIVGSLLCKFVKPGISNGLLAAIFFVPALLYWVSEKSLSEISGYGFNAKFDDAAAMPIESLLPKVGDAAIASLLPSDPLFKLASFFEACSKYFVVRPHLIPEYGADTFAAYIVNSTNAIRSSLACDQFVGLVVLDENDHYIGSYDRGFFAEALSLWAVSNSNQPMDKELLASRIQSSTIFGAALRFPKLRIREFEGYVGAINEESTLNEAFAAFQVMHGSFLTVTDELGKFKGIVTRDYVERALLQALVSSSSDTIK